MKKLCFLLIFVAIFLQLPAFCEDMTDFDYQFIDNAFSNTRPVSNKQFEEVMKKYENPEPRGLGYKIKRFFNKDNPEYDKKFKTQYEAPNNQPLRIKDAPPAKPTVTIGADFYYNTKGESLPAGHYQVDYRNEEGLYSITLLQGNTRVADIKAYAYEDNEANTGVVYARSETLNGGNVKIIYSNLDITLCGYVKLKN